MERWHSLESTFTCYYRKPRCKLAPQWIPGIWLGKTSEGTEDMHIVSTPNGILKGRAIRRSAEPWRGPWIFLCRDQPFKVNPRKKSLRFEGKPAPMPKIVEDQDAEDVLNYAKTHGDSEDESEPAFLPEKPKTTTDVLERKEHLAPPEIPIAGMETETSGKRQASKTLEDLEAEEYERIGHEVPQTPPLLDDSEVIESPTSRPRLEGPTGSLYAPTFAGNVNQTYYTDDVDWEEELFEELIEDDNFGESFEEEDDLLAGKEGKPPELTEEQLQEVERKSGEEEIQRLFDLNVIVEPNENDMREGILLSTTSVFDWRWRNQRWSRRCRLVAREFRAGDHSNASTYAPTSNSLINRLTLCMHLCYGWRLSFVDVKNAFLLVPQQEAVIIEVPAWWRPEEMVDGMPRFWALRRCLPGQRNAASRWYTFLATVLEELGFAVSAIAPAVFRHRERKVMLCAHVDDLAICGQEDDLTWCLGELRKRFEVSGGEIYPQRDQNPEDPVRFLKRRYYFGKDGIITKTHEKYIPSLVKAYNLENRRGKGTPEGSMQQLDVGEPLSFEAKRKFRSALGTLLYLTQDRIDVQHGVRNLSQSMSSPTRASEASLKHLILYLKRTENFGVLLPYMTDFRRKQDQVHGDETPGSEHYVEVYVDADWGGDQSSAEKRRHSISSCLIFVNNVMVMVQSWSRSQKSIALSSCESEFLALIGGAAEGLHVGKLWEFISGKKPKVYIYTDSSSCLALTQKLGVGRVKHLDAKTLWVQAMTKNGELEVWQI